MTKPLLLIVFFMFALSYTHYAMNTEPAKFSYGVIKEFDSKSFSRVVIRGVNGCKVTTLDDVDGWTGTFTTSVCTETLEL